MRTRLWALPIVAFFLAATALSADPLKPVETPKPVTVPLEVLPSKHLAVQVKVNGKGPYRLIFDTGAPLVIVNNKAAADSGLIPKDAADIPFALFGAKGQFAAKTFELGDVKVDKLPIMVLDHPTLGLLGKTAGPVDGIVGYPFFARFKFAVDYQAKQLTLTPNGAEPEDIVETLLPKLLAARRSPPILAPAAQWGLVVAKKDGDDEPGVTVSEVRPGSAAATAGLKVGDRLLTIEGRWTDSVADCFQAAALVKPDARAVVVYRREGKERQATVTPRPGL